MKPLALLLISALCCAAQAKAQAQSPDLATNQLQIELQRLAQAQHIRFRAMLIMSMANQLTTVRLAPGHARADGALPTELNVAPDGLRLEHSGNPALRLQQRSWHAPEVRADDLARIERGYRVQLLALDQIDGRDALPLRFDPVDRWRYGTTLWVDRSTGLVVKTEMRGIDGQTLAQAMLAQVELLDPASSPDTNPEAPRATQPMRWQIKGLPDGFSVIRAAPEADEEQFLIGDGVASVSVFIEPLIDGRSAQRGSQQRGLLATQAEVRGDYQLIAIGAVPPATIERILNGLTPAD